MGIYGLDEFFLKHPAKNARNELELIDALRKRPLTKSILIKVSKRLGLTVDQQAQIYGVAPRTYKKKSGRSNLSFRASEHVVLLIELYTVGAKYFDDNEESFVNWISAKIFPLGNRKPIDLLTSVLGINLVKTEIYRMVHGIPP